MSDDRAVTPVVSKTLEVGIVLLFIGGLSAALFGGVVPDYRDAAGDRVAERTLAGATTEVEDAVPPPARAVRVERRVSLPETIRGARYRVVADDGSLALDHPNEAVGDRLRLALPERVATVTGAWRSGATTVVVVTGGDGAVTVELVNR
ncbi:DUF7266 family protein [Halobaculum marinum]|uniref:Uncharacterized protein n=1 Tax=Halobaculum marinum TaxID=3031996 RepID=A0ABD5WVQ3_9EURY|nr:hypothetical protein [Halobaculum sp. DT55]